MVSPSLTEGLPFSVKSPQITCPQIHPEVCLLGDFKSPVGDGDEPSQHSFIITHHCLLYPDCGNHQFTFCLCGFAYSSHCIWMVSYEANSRTLCQKCVQFSFFPFQIATLFFHPHWEVQRTSALRDKSGNESEDHAWILPVNVESVLVSINVSLSQPRVICGEKPQLRKCLLWAHW